ncbi:MAG: cobaltochelatase subunit CobN [Burkholderiaceae bacterium]
MHLLSTRAGGHVEDGGQGIVRVDQTPGDIVVLSAADTTLSLLAEAVDALPDDFPSVRLVNLMWLRQPASMDLYMDDVDAGAGVGDRPPGQSERLAYVVEQAVSLAARKGVWLALFSGDNVEDPQLLMRGTADAADAPLAWRCLREGGRENAQRFFSLIGHRVFGRGEGRRPHNRCPRWRGMRRSPRRFGGTVPRWLCWCFTGRIASGNTAVFDALIAALHQGGMNPLAVAVDSLKAPTTLAAVRSLASECAVDVVLNATSFAVAAIDGDGQARTPLAGDAPVLQLITAGGTREQWQEDPHGLTPRDLAMQVVLPEVDGRIATRAISFKGLAWRCERAQIDVVRYQPEGERIGFVAELARRWCVLRRKAPADRRLALVLANYPNDDARLANGVGLDTPASTVGILAALKAHGYQTGEASRFPSDGNALMDLLVDGVTNDLDANPARPAGQSLAMGDYMAAFLALAPEAQAAVNALWGPPEQDPMVRGGRFMIPGLRLGGVFVGIQPARGRDLDLVASYHDADLVPPHAYLAFHFWLRLAFEVDAVVHVGKHGNLEWLPGKSVALGAACWPDALLGPMPHLYPFIVNDPGEGSQAKRRTQAVIVDHLMPALTRAETYGPLQVLERQMDEYYEALSLDPRRAKRLRQAILEQVLNHRLHTDLGFEPPADEAARERLLERLDAYLCEIKESQIRDGLHILGRSPMGRQRTDTLVALARFPGGRDAAQGSLLVALAQDLGLADFDPWCPIGVSPGRGHSPPHCRPWAHRPGATRTHPRAPGGPGGPGGVGRTGDRVGPVAPNRDGAGPSAWRAGASAGRLR